VNITDGCSHRFRAAGTSRPHYCTYIQVEGLLATFPKFLKTTDDFLLYSLVSSTVLWSNLQKIELRSIERLLAARISSGSYYVLAKRLRRCDACASILLRQVEIAKSWPLHCAQPKGTKLKPTILISPRNGSDIFHPMVLWCDCSCVALPAPPPATPPRASHCCRGVPLWRGRLNTIS